MNKLIDALRDARGTLVKTATGRLGSDELTIPRSAFDSVVRNLDAALRQAQSTPTNEGA